MPGRGGESGTAYRDLLHHDPVRQADDMLARALGHCLRHQREDGGWRSPPDPRVTETALACLALSREATPAARHAVRRARQWLRTARPQTHHPLAQYTETLLAGLACGTGDGHGLGTEAFTGPVFAPRLRLLAVLRACAERVAPDGAGHEPVTADGLRALRAGLRTAVDGAARSRLKSWALVDLLAEHALVERYFGAAQDAEAAARRLADLQAPDGSFYGNVLSTSLALLALHAVVPAGTARYRARGYLLTAQHPDGTWRFLTTDVWDTQLTVRAFRGEPDFDVQGLPRALDFLRAAQRPDGGWPCRQGLESDNDTTAAVLLALAGLPEAADAARGALRHLAEQQSRAGLWSTWQAAGDPPAPDVVAHAVTALDRYRGRHRVPTGAARRWLLAYAGRAGATGDGWAASWYRGAPYAVCEIAPALPPGHRAVRAELTRLAASRRPDGGWAHGPDTGSLPSATGLALAALYGAAGPGNGTRAVGPGGGTRAALAYLAAAQRADGSWPGRPEMYGPRPLLSHSPAQTLAFTVLGLTAARRALRGPRRGEW
ncbi:prenyltransferase/squalene oxidase repeat-containing protein [Streptomyces sp. NPDC053542]|uniref:prenyltransferase/squalene oxidase repeat-containing protein n=1 Tax=Streptomyces sp. NPDC053542 TaxID=3365710 RepID=UPI0037D2A3A2